jgi:hypothetical protein
MSQSITVQLRAGAQQPLTRVVRDADGQPLRTLEFPSTQPVTLTSPEDIAAIARDLERGGLVKVDPTQPRRSEPSSSDTKLVESLRSEIKELHEENDDLVAELEAAEVKIELLTEELRKLAVDSPLISEPTTTDELSGRATPTQPTASAEPAASGEGRSTKPKPAKKAKK